MSKRSAEDHVNNGVSLKGGDRPEKPGLEDEVGEFEDEFEDEYESEDEILEAGLDGRPDAEREAEEKTGKRNPWLISSCLRSLDVSNFR
jgi:ribosome assembly protein RRB1